MLRTIIIDDEKLAIDRLVELLNMVGDIDIVATINDPETAAQIIIHEKPDLVFIDIEMPRISGFDIIQEVKNSGIETTFVVTTGYDHYAIKAIKKAAFDFLVKPVDLDELKECLDRYSKEKKSKDEMLVDTISHLETKPKLSERELEVLQHILKGRTSAEIAKILFISKNTVDTHRRNIIEKLGVKNTKELLALKNIRF